MAIQALAGVCLFVCTYHTVLVCTQVQAVPQALVWQTVLILPLALHCIGLFCDGIHEAL